MISLRTLLTCICSLFILTVPITSRAEIALSFFPTEDAKFLFKGEGSEGAATVYLTVDYDTSHLFAPHVTVTGGKLLQDVHQDAPPGRLHIAIQTEEYSPTFEACLFFQKPDDLPAVINFVTAESIGPDGRQQPVAVAMLANPNLPLQSPAEIAKGDETAVQGLRGAQSGGHGE